MSKKRKWEVYEDPCEIDLKESPPKKSKCLYSFFTLEWHTANGTLFSVSQRREFWKEWSPVVGKMIEPYENVEFKIFFVNQNFSLRMDDLEMEQIVVEFLMENSSVVHTCQELSKFMNGRFSFEFSILQLIELSTFFMSTRLENRIRELVETIFLIHPCPALISEAALVCYYHQEWFDVYQCFVNLGSVYIHQCLQHLNLAFSKNRSMQLFLSDLISKTYFVCGDGKVGKRKEIFEYHSEQNPFLLGITPRTKRNFLFRFPSPYHVECKKYQSLIVSKDEFLSRLQQQWGSEIYWNMVPWTQNSSQIVLTGECIVFLMSAIPLGKLVEWKILDFSITNSGWDHLMGFFSVLYTISKNHGQRVLFLQTGNIMIVNFIDSKKQIRVTVTEFSSPAEIISSFPLDYHQCYFDGKKVVCSPSCIESWETRHVGQIYSDFTPQKPLSWAWKMGFDISHNYKKEFTVFNSFQQLCCFSQILEKEEEWVFGIEEYEKCVCDYENFIQDLKIRFFDPNLEIYPRPMFSFPSILYTSIYDLQTCHNPDYLYTFPLLKDSQIFTLYLPQVKVEKGENCIAIKCESDHFYCLTLRVFLSYLITCGYTQSLICFEKIEGQRVEIYLSENQTEILIPTLTDLFENGIFDLKIRWQTKNLQAHPECIIKSPWG